MKLTLEKRTMDCLTESINHSNIRSIKEILGRRNKVEPDHIGFFTYPDDNLQIFFKSLIGPGDEVITAGPTNENILQKITSCDASYFEFYEKPLFLPDLLGLVGRVTTRTKLIVLGNPNRYTGVVYSQREIEHILNISENIIVVLDESTYESSQITCLDLIDKYNNLAIIRSLENEINPLNGKMEYIISSPKIINKTDKSIIDTNFSSPELYIMLNNLKNQENKLGKIKDARQEMLYLSIRLRMYGVNCFLNPDYSFVIKMTQSDELLFRLNEIGVQASDMARFPGLSGNILIPFDLDVDAISIINVFERIENDKKQNRYKNNRLAAYQPLNTENEVIIERNQDIFPNNRLESNMVF